MNEQPREESIDRFFEQSSSEAFLDEVPRTASDAPAEDFDEVAFFDQVIIDDVEASDDETNVEPLGLQFGLKSLLSLILVVGGVLELWLTHSLLFLSTALLGLFILSWRRPAGMERTYSLLMYGGGLGVCAGLIISFVGSSSLGFVGLMFASVCSFVALHGALAPLLTTLASFFSR